MLIALFEIAFRDSMEHAGYSAAELHAAAQKTIGAHFERRTSNPWHQASLLVEEDAAIVAAALINEMEGSPILEPIDVHPNHQRRKLGTSLLHQVINRLLALGAVDLRSHCHLGNASSMAWHLACGFEESTPDLWSTTHRARYYRYELERHAQLGDMPNEQIAELRRLSEHWEAEWERLSEMRIVR
jgi:GNAT superfamily N-acetyltransferase